MDLDVGALIDRTVTVFNRVPAKVSGKATDVYRVAVLHPASWYETTTKTTSADGTVSFGRTVRIQVPETTADYMEPEEFAAKAAQGATEGAFTLSAKDYAVLGDTGVTGDLTRQQATEAMAGRQACEVATVRDLRNGKATGAPSAGVLKYVSVVYAEGR